MSEQTNSVACFKHIPDGQRFVFKLEPGAGELMKASTIGAVIRNMSRILKSSTTAEIQDEEVFVTGMKMNDNGGIELEFSVLPRAKDEDGE